MRAFITGALDQRDWTFTDAAVAMTKAGCPIDQSAVWKTISAGRRITLDEAVAYSTVFGTPLAEMIGKVPRCVRCNGRPPAGYLCTYCGKRG